MNPKLRQLLGLVTIGLFGTVGASFLMEGRQGAGIVLCGLALLRLLRWVQDQARLMRADD